MWTWIPLFLELGALAGCAYLIYAGYLLEAVFRRRQATRTRLPSVTILKPLHGAEPLLYENLRSFCTQDYDGEVQVVLGVDSPSDAALPIARRLQSDLGDADIDVVVRARGPAANPKIGNLANMIGRARNEVVVIADSDVHVRASYLGDVIRTLLVPGTGAVTCLYEGVGAAGFWSRLSAAAIETHFVPSVVFGMAVGLARPCFGSTIAMRRRTLDEIGGFGRFADVLADDYAIGAAIRETGAKVAVAPITVTHICHETSLAAVLRHELRWARTIRSIDGAGFAGSVVTHPFGLAVLALATGGGVPAAGMAALAVTCRLIVWARLDTVLGRPPSSYWLIPLRSLLSFAVFAASFLGREVDWQGQRYEVDEDGTLTPPRSSTP